MRSDPVNLFEYEARAKDALPAADFDFIAGGAADEVTLHATRQAYDAIRLRPRVLIGVSSRDLSTTVLGQAIALPVMPAPASRYTIAHPEGELALAGVAEAAGLLMVLSSGSSYTLEEVAKATRAPLWFQQYLFNDRGLTTLLADRAAAAGYRALCITLDSSIRAKRERDLRNHYANAVPRLYAGVDLQQFLQAGAGGARQGMGGLLSPATTRKDFEWLAGQTRLPLVAKGIMTAEDARLACGHGARAVIVSNHGARQLDTTQATIEALPEVVHAVRGAAEVYLDGGIRRGTDILKALALGARAVLIGRPLFWGLAVEGAQGAAKVVGILWDELDGAMAMCGRTSITGIDRTVLATRPT